MLTSGHGPTSQAIPTNPTYQGTPPRQSPSDSPPLSRRIDLGLNPHLNIQIHPLPQRNTDDWILSQKNHCECSPRLTAALLCCLGTLFSVSCAPILFQFVNNESIPKSGRLIAFSFLLFCLILGLCCVNLAFKKCDEISKSQRNSLLPR